MLLVDNVCLLVMFVVSCLFLSYRKRFVVCRLLLFLDGRVLLVGCWLSLCGVRCLLCVVLCCRLCVVCRVMLFGVGCSLPTVVVWRWLLLVVCCLWFEIVCCWL